MTTPFDYDRSPERFRLAIGVTRRYLRAGRRLYTHQAHAAAASRRDAPELAEVWRPPPPASTPRTRPT